MTNTHGLHVKKPISVWNQPLKANFKDLFKSLAKATISGATLNWVEMGKNTADALTAVGLEKDAGQIAWLLIYRSIERALHSLVEENLDLIKSGSTEHTKAREEEQQSELSEEAVEMVTGKLDFSVEQSELVIDEAFFKKPGELAVLRQIALPFAQWLRGSGLTEVQAVSISDRLPVYFVYALSEEWRARRDDYKILTEALDTPFTKASEREQSWARYSAMLQKQIEEPMFYEAFSLRQVYVPLRAFYERKTEGTQGKGIAEGVTQKAARQRVAIDLEKELKGWLSKTDPQDAIRVISGGPGSGKSSFAKMFAAQQCAQTERRVLFVPLHRFEPTDDLIDALKEFVSLDGFLAHNPLDPKEGDSRLLIIFDGLDELSMQGKVAAEVAQRFVQEVQRKVESFNAREPRLKVLISGRELAVQANVDGFRKPQQVLHILPYYLPESIDKRLTSSTYIDEHNLLEQDQRQLWWAAYGKASGRGYEGMPKVLEREALIEITSQPLLNYLVALSYGRGALDFATESSLNVIYDDLLKAIYQRVWGEHQHPAVNGITEDQFFRILEEIAVAAWHGDGRTTTVREVEAHCVNSGLNPLLEKFKEGAKEGVARLLMAFYFRKSGNREATGDETFEFTHKSFGEYLAAKRIVRGVQRMHTELERRKQSYDGGWDERDALIYWAKLCGPVAMDTYLNEFVRNEVRLHGQSGDTSNPEQWQKTLSRLIGFMLRHGTPMESLVPRHSFKDEVHQARNAEEALLAALNACARVTMTLSNIDWPSREAFGEWLSRFQGQRIGGHNPLAFSCLSLLNLQDIILHLRDLYGADLRHANLERTDLALANLMHVNLSDANLSEANLEGTNLSEANLEGANLERANFAGANFEGARFSSANFERARLEGARLKGAYIGNTTISKAQRKRLRLSQK